MRLWSLHPQYLDRQGLVALWREALLAKAVLRGQTKGYRHHPQLVRFREHSHPRYAINFYLAGIYDEAVRRGYRFDHSKVGPLREVKRIGVTTGQIEYEWAHLIGKLSLRTPQLAQQWSRIARPSCHPLFHCRTGPVEPWERIGED